jgi:hypothetical protein
LTRFECPARSIIASPIAVPFRFPDPPVSLLRLRGVILNEALSCPICGGETMRISRPRGLRVVLSLLRCRYRLCRHCFRTWLAWR